MALTRCWLTRSPIAVCIWPIDTKRHALFRLAGSHNYVSVVGHYLLTDRRANTRTGVLTAPKQPLEDLKDALQLLLLNANTVVGNLNPVISSVH